MRTQLQKSLPGMLWTSVFAAASHAASTASLHALLWTTLRMTMLASIPAAGLVGLDTNSGLAHSDMGTTSGSVCGPGSELLPLSLSRHPGLHALLHRANLLPTLGHLSLLLCAALWYDWQQTLTVMLGVPLMPFYLAYHIFQGRKIARNMYREGLYGAPPGVVVSLGAVLRSEDGLQGMFERCVIVCLSLSACLSASCIQLS